MAFIKNIGTATCVLIGINILMFFSVRILFMTGSVNPVEWSGVSAEWHRLLVCPWVLLTYMFTQTDVWHLLFNMLWLGCTGLLLNGICSQRTIATVYLTGGVAGATVFMLTASHPSMLLGASSAVLSVMTFAAWLIPDHQVNLLFLGRVKLKWVITGAVALYLAGSLPSAADVAVHAAGAIAGVVYAIAIKQKRTKIGSARSTLHISSHDELILNGLLDKVRQSGFASLTPAERNLLIDISKKKE